MAGAVKYIKPPEEKIINRFLKNKLGYESAIRELMKTMGDNRSDAERRIKAWIEYNKK